jgi:hypothetical protein
MLVFENFDVQRLTIRHTQPHLSLRFGYPYALLLRCESSALCLAYALLLLYRVLSPTPAGHKAPAAKFPRPSIDKEMAGRRVNVALLRYSPRGRSAERSRRVP